MAHGCMCTSFLVRLPQSNMLYVENYRHPPPGPKNWTLPESNIPMFFLDVGHASRRMRSMVQ